MVHRGAWLCGVVLSLLAIPRDAPAQVHQCCQEVPTGACVARPSSPIPECRAGTRFHLDCDTVCCIEHTFDDPCPGDIPSCLPNLGDDVCGDTDGDGLINGWETNGVDFNGDGTIEPNENLPAMGANPNRIDLFVEADCMVASDHSHCPTAQAIQDVVQAFANAPVSNPDGTTGIQLHVDVGPLFGAGAIFQVPSTNGGGVVGTFGDFGGGNTLPELGNTIINFNGFNNATDFHTLKALYFDAGRSQVFRYMIWGHQTNVRALQYDCTSGLSPTIPSKDFFVTLGGTHSDGTPCWYVDANGFSVGSRFEQAGTFMHEFGHTLGLQHGGNEGTNKKPNYLSVMNYAYQDCGVPQLTASNLPGLCDYSRLAPLDHGLIDLDETNLDECIGYGAGFGVGPIDWSGDFKLEGATCQPPLSTTDVVADTNFDGRCVSPGIDGTYQTVPGGDDGYDDGYISDGRNRSCDSTAIPDDLQLTAVGQTPPQEQVLRSFKDWAALQYSVLAVGADGGSGAPAPLEADPDAIATARQNLSNTTLPILDVTDQSPATVLPGQTVTYSVAFENVGHGPALNTTAVNLRPDGTQDTIDLGTLIVGANAARSFTYQVPADACPQDLTDDVEAQWTDMASVPHSGSARAVTRVLDIVPPQLSLSLSPTELWPPNRQFVTITATVSATDNCDPNPAIHLVSIVSNEPGSDQVAGAAFGTDDRQFQVRAERNGTGTGRVYTVTYEAVDASGNRTPKQATITVPHNR